MFRQTKDYSGYHSSVQMVSSGVRVHWISKVVKAGLAVPWLEGGCWDAGGAARLLAQEPDAAPSRPGSCNQLPFSHHS